MLLRNATNAVAAAVQTMVRTISLGFFRGGKGDAPLKVAKPAFPLMEVGGVGSGEGINYLYQA